MRYKTGEVVIKKTGGNKMVISEEYDNNGEFHYRCYWFVGSEFNEKVFKGSDLVTLDEYKSILKKEERDDKINQILK